MTKRKRLKQTIQITIIKDNKNDNERSLSYAFDKSI